VTIKKSKKWWIGSESADMHEYLKAFSANSYPIDQFRLAQCRCSAEVFFLEADRDGGVAQRKCAGCQTSHFICDSEQFWAESEPESWYCLKCQSKSTNVGVGFVTYPDSPNAVKWIYLGVRCAECGLLGCFADWKVGEENVGHFFDQV